MKLVVLSDPELFEQNDDMNLSFDDGKIIGVIADDMDGDSYVDLLVTQEDGGKKKATIIPQTGGKFDSKLDSNRKQIQESGRIHLWPTHAIPEIRRFEIPTENLRHSADRQGHQEGLHFGVKL